MSAVRFSLATILLLLGSREIDAHGRLMEPVGRSSAWRKGFENAPKNFNDNELFCGGFKAQQENEGKCGVCGDNYGDSQPRSNEHGGYYGTGTIVKSYTKNQQINVVVNVTANHLGHFQFAVCPLSGAANEESEECFEKYPVKLADGSDKFEIERGVIGDVALDVVLPEDLSCDHCSFRWHYSGGNNWGFCEDGTGSLGCGPQETFRSCADIKIE